MAEPAPAPTAPAPTAPRARSPSPADIEPFEPFDPFERDPLTGLGVELVESLPVLPSLEALHRLTEHDLPCGDGLPVPDGSVQWLVLSHTYHAFERHFRHRSDVFVGCDGLVYAEGVPDARGWVRPFALGPDVMVAFGVEERHRQSYVIWQEGGPPVFVLEVASPSTWRRDRDVKPGMYASMGVREYFLYDPVGGRLEPRLQGHVLEGGAYRALPPGRTDQGVSGVWSEVLGLWAYLKGEDGELRWYDPETGEELETPAEVHEAREAEAAAREAEATARKAAEARAEEEAAARKAAEEKLAELEARLRALERSPHG